MWITPLYLLYFKCKIRQERINDKRFLFKKAKQQCKEKLKGVYPEINALILNFFGTISCFFVTFLHHATHSWITHWHGWCF